MRTLGTVGCMTCIDLSKIAHVTCHACRIIGREHVDMLLAEVLAVASELPGCSTAPGGEAGGQAVREASEATACSADDAQPRGSTPPGASNEHFPCWHQCVSWLTQLSCH